MIYHVLSLFPNMFDAPLNQSIIGRGQEAGLLEIHTHQIRDFTKNRQRQVDDYPYGGGGGLIMTAQPLHDAWKHAKAISPNAHTIYFSPKGRRFTQEDAKRLSKEQNAFILVCGHYEGIDQRFIDLCVDEEISIGDFVLTGGEIPALAFIDATARLLPGVLSSEDSFTNESHWKNTLEHPHYTRPPVWEDMPVPTVLQNGVHQEIDTWRRKLSFSETIKRRPDLFRKLLFSKEDLRILDALKQETDDPHIKVVLNKLHTGRITVRPFTDADDKRIAKLFSKDTSPPSKGFALYADDLGFCGCIAYEIVDTHILLSPYIKTHAKDKGILSYALNIVCNALFADAAITACFLPKGLSPNLYKRLGFSAIEDGFLLTREAFLQLQ